MYNLYNVSHDYSIWVSIDSPSKSFLYHLHPESVVKKFPRLGEKPPLMFMRHMCLTGNRGLLFEVGDASEDLDLTEATPGYSWQIVPNASSPSGFWSKEGQPFRYVCRKSGCPDHK